ncbi:hypothetical protein Ancab_017583 [Ancistrocladus abbreviatus]
MKLRIRSLESKITQRIEVPNSSTLQQLKETIFGQISLASPSSSPVTPNLLLSLNGKDEFCGSSPEDTIQSLGVISGDLIYYSLNPYAFSSKECEIVSAQTENPPNLNTQNDQTLDTMKLSKNKSIVDDRTENLMNTQMEESLKLISDQSKDLMKIQMEETLEMSFHEAKDLGNSGEEVDEIDDMEVEEEESALDGKASFSVPSFLRKVFVKEVGDASDGGDHRLLVIAVHAVLLESGFVGYDPISGMKVDGFHLPDEWPSSAFTISLCYTIPEILSSEVVESVVLKFQTLGKFVNVYASLTKKGFGLYRLSLDESRVVPALNFVWKNSEYIDTISGTDGSEKLDREREVFDFWRIVKDGLALPLLIDLCEKAGLPPPSCFMLLPTELKLKILEFLPGVDVSRMACVCSELRFISSNNDLWRLKYIEEFGIAAERQSQNWKARFYSALESRKKRKRHVLRRNPRLAIPHFPRIIGDPNPFGTPYVIGTYDRFPVIMHSPRYGPAGRRSFLPSCNFGGFNR